MLEMLGDSMLQDPGRDVPEVACRDGEEGVADERVGLGERDDLVAARHVEYLSPVSLEVLHEIDARRAILCAGRGERDHDDGTQNRETAIATQISHRFRSTPFLPIVIRLAVRTRPAVSSTPDTDRSQLVALPHVSFQRLSELELP